MVLKMLIMSDLERKLNTLKKVIVQRSKTILFELSTKLVDKSHYIGTFTLLWTYKQTTPTPSQHKVSLKPLTPHFE